MLGMFMIISMFYVVDDKSFVFSENFECGYYPISCMMLKNKMNYWMITIHFLIFELELCLLCWLCFKLVCVNEDVILAWVFSVLCADSVI